MGHLQAMQTPNSLSSESTEIKLQYPTNLQSPPSSVLRLWRPAAQRNLRNQWSKLASHKQKWVSASSTGRSHATSLVNAHLSKRYIPSMDLGVLSNIPYIQYKACLKLACQQELYGKKLLASYKDMVGVVSHMITDSRSMRCFLKGPAGSPHIQFSNYSEDTIDLGDGGGIPVFTFWSIPYHEKLAQEFVQMFASELVLKRLLVLELLSLDCDEQEADKLRWTDELYPGEFEALSSSGLSAEETCQPIPPRISGHKSDFDVTAHSNIQPDQEVLQVHLTTWIVEVNVDTQRVEEILSIIGEELHVKLS